MSRRRRRGLPGKIWAQEAPSVQGESHVQRPCGGRRRDRTGPRPAFAGKPRHRERRGPRDQGHAAGRGGPGGVRGRHAGLGPRQALCLCTPARTFQALLGRAAASASQAVLALAGRCCPVPSFNYKRCFPPSLNYATDAGGSAAIGSHLLAWDNGTQ